MWREPFVCDSVAIQEASLVIQFDEYREVNELILTGERFFHIIKAMSKAYD